MVVRGGMRNGGLEEVAAYKPLSPSIPVHSPHPLHLHVWYVAWEA